MVTRNAFSDYSVFSSRKVTIPSCSLVVQKLFQGPQILKVLQSLKNTKHQLIRFYKPPKQGLDLVI